MTVSRTYADLAARTADLAGLFARNKALYGDSTMDLNLFIPTVWAANTLEVIDTKLVYGQPGVSDRNYEGELAGYGSSVKINTVNNLTITDYAKYGVISPEQLTDAQTSLTLDQAKAFNFLVDSIDVRQVKGDVVGDGLRRAAYGLAKQADLYIAGLGVTAAAATGSLVNTIGTDAAPIDLTGANFAGAYALLLQCQQTLDEHDAPDEDRVAIVPPAFIKSMLLDTRFTAGFQTGEEKIMNGVVTRVAGFTILSSNNVPATGAVGSKSKYKIQCSAAGARSFVENLTELDEYKPEKSFGRGYKGLHVYGGAIIRPQFLVVATVNV